MRAINHSSPKFPLAKISVAIHVELVYAAAAISPASNEKRSEIKRYMETNIVMIARKKEVFAAITAGRPTRVRIPPTQ